MAYLIPGRECGDCTLCCIVPGIDKADLQKLPASTCRFCDHGCAIYETRPEVCREYYCGWRKLEMIPEDWRPDIFGVFAEVMPQVAPQFSCPFGLILILTGNPLKTLRQHDFLDFVIRNLNNNFALFLGLPGPRGKQCAHLPLNTREICEAARRSRSDTRLALEKILKRLTAHDYIPQILEFSGNDVST
jgi:hypothetical protein